MKLRRAFFSSMFIVMTMHGQTEAPLKESLSSLNFFVGTWSCDGHFFKGDRKISSDMKFVPDLNGAWITLRHDDRPPNQFHAMESWGFNDKTREFVAVITDNFGGVRLFTSRGWKDDVLVWTGDKLSAAQPGAQTFTFEKKGEKQFSMTFAVMESAEKWRPVDTLTCNRE